MSSHAATTTHPATAPPSAATTNDRLRRVIGALFVLGAVTFGTAATVLSSTFNWPDILREPASVVLPEYADGGTSLVWTWFAVAWTYGILLLPILLLPSVLGRRDDPVMRAATFRPRQHRLGPVGRSAGRHTPDATTDPTEGPTSMKQIQSGPMVGKTVLVTGATFLGMAALLPFPRIVGG